MANYFIITTISSIAFYAIYYGFLRKESFHQFNRVYLLGAVVASLLIPFLRFSVSEIAALFSTQHATDNLSEMIAYIQLPELTITAVASSWWNFSNLFRIIYFSGVLLFTILFIIKLVKIGSLIFQSEKNRKGKYVFVQNNENVAPFSFFKYIFINKDAYNEEDLERIVLHEQIHVQKRHSWDLVFMELVGIFLWFNPVILLYKRSLQIIHEYMADHCVLQRGIDLGAYFNLLLRQLTVPNEWMLGHHFNYLLTKKRFKMLKNHHYSKWALAKSMYVAPFIVFLLLLNCKHNPEEELLLEENNPTTEITDPEPLDIDHVDVILVDKDGKERTDYTLEKIYNFVDVMPDYPGGMPELYKFVRENTTYPQEAQDKGIEGTVVVTFVVSKDGSVTNVNVLSSVDPLLDAESVRVIKKSPKWTPGKMHGEPVSCWYNLPITFTLQ